MGGQLVPIRTLVRARAHLPFHPVDNVRQIFWAVGGGRWAVGGGRGAGHLLRCRVARATLAPMDRLSRHLWRWLPAAVVLAGGLIYAWVVGGAPGTVWLTGARVDLPAGEIAYPGRDHLERVDPMGSLPAPPLKEAVDTRAEEDVGSRR